MSKSIRNVHRRVLDPATSEQVSALVALLASDEDVVWPSDRWPAMKLDNGLTTGSSGGHGPVPYSLDLLEPNRIVFRFDLSMGIDGTHALEWRDIGGQRVEIVHTVAGVASGTMVLKWPALVEPLHDALIEDAFDSLEAAVHKVPLQRRPLSVGVRARRRALIWVRRVGVQTRDCFGDLSGSKPPLHAANPTTHN